MEPEHGVVEAPDDWVLLPTGQAFVTKTVKSTGVSWFAWTPRSRKSSTAASWGCWHPGELAQAIVEYLQFAPQHQSLAAKIAESAAARAAAVGSGRVGRTGLLPLGEQAALAARVQIRHQYTNYHRRLDELGILDDQHDLYRAIKADANEDVDTFLRAHRIEPPRPTGPWTCVAALEICTCLTADALRCRVALMSTDRAALTLAEHTRERTRAARHARSFPLLCGAVGLLLLVWAKLDHPFAFFVEALIPLGVFLLLYLVMSARRMATGLGIGTDGYGVLVVIGAFAGTLLLPAAVFLGTVFFLGVGLVILGWRGQDRGLWVPGAVLVAASPLLTFFVFDNHAHFLGAHPSAVVLAVGGVVLIGLGIRALVSERAVLALTIAAEA